MADTREPVRDIDLVQGYPECQNKLCTTRFPVDLELICPVCWDLLRQDLRFADIYARYQQDVEEIKVDPELSPEERAEAIKYQRYEVESNFLQAINPESREVVPRRPGPGPVPTPPSN